LRIIIYSLKETEREREKKKCRASAVKSSQIKGKVGQRSIIIGGGFYYLLFLRKRDFKF